MSSSTKVTKKVVKKAAPKKAAPKKAAPKKAAPKKAPVIKAPVNGLAMVPSYAEGSNANYCEDVKFEGFRMREIAAGTIRIHVHRTVVRNRLSQSPSYVAMDVPKSVLVNILKAL